MPVDLEPIEAAVLQKLLAGDHPILVALRQQMPGLSVRAREHTGAGFFTEFSVANDGPRAPIPSGKLRFGDVEASVKGLRNGAGFLLYVDDGLLHMLEDYSYEEPWPDSVGEFSLHYSEPSRKSVLASLG